MPITCVFDDPELKEKFKKDHTDNKKLKALDNYSQVRDFSHKNFLNLLRHCLDCGFLGEEETSFLTHIVDKYKINYLDWSHRTAWLKEEMSIVKVTQKKPHMEQMDLFENKLAPMPVNYSIPFELLAQQQRQMMSARI